MYKDYETESRDWERRRSDSKVPAFVVVANTINNANGLYRYIAGYEQEEGVAYAGRLGELLGNWDANGRSYDEPRTILMHSKMESSEGGLNQALARPIRVLADLYRDRFPNAQLSEDRRDKRRLSDGDDREVLRRVLNTVGKPGEPGARVRCVVSVGMITEGWDARTVTHMVGFRAFGSQLLCEQVGAGHYGGASTKSMTTPGASTPNTPLSLVSPGATSRRPGRQDRLTPRIRRRPTPSAWYQAGKSIVCAGPMWWNMTHSAGTKSWWSAWRTGLRFRSWSLSH